MKKFLIVLLVEAVLVSFSGCGLFGGVSERDLSQEDKYYGAFFVQDNLEYVKEIVEGDLIDVNGATSMGGNYDYEYSPVGLVLLGDQNRYFLEYLLGKGASPDVAYGDKTPLMCILGGDEEMNSHDPDIVNLLLEYKADVKLKDKAGMTALDYAVSDNIELEIVETLLSAGAEVSGKTLAILQRGVDGLVTYKAARLVFEAAEKQGLDFDDKLFSAVVLGKSDEALTLLKEGSDYAENIPLYAAAYCSPNVLEYLVKKGFDLTASDSDGGDSLQVAAAAGNLDVVKYLVEGGASLDFSSYNYTDYDPLKASIIYDHYDVAKYLLESGAKFNINDEVGFDGDRIPQEQPFDSLQGAIINNNEKMLSLIFKYDYPNNRNTKARMLESAIIFENNDMLKIFLEDGADRNPPSDILTSQDSLADTCALYGGIESLKILDEYGTKLADNNNHALGDLVYRNKKDQLEYLLNKGMPVDAKYDYGDGSISDTAWQKVADHGYFDIIKLLVEHGADVNDEQVNYIVANGGESYNILKYLIENGADVDRQDKDGNTALIMAAQNNRAENAKLLLESGADTGIKNKEGKTALDMAKDYGSKDVEKLINSN